MSPVFYSTQSPIDDVHVIVHYIEFKVEAKFNPSTSIVKQSQGKKMVPSATYEQSVTEKSRAQSSRADFWRI